MKKGIAVICLTVMLTCLAGGIAWASEGSERAAQRTTDYLKGLQHEDGGYGQTESNLTDTASAIIALKAMGEGLPKTKSGETPVSFLAEKAPDLSKTDEKTAVKNTAKIAQLVMALVLADENPEKFAGVNWVALLKEQQEKATGWFGLYDIDHMWAMLALDAAGDDPGDSAVKWLQKEQNEDGGYSIDKAGGMVSDTNSTALAIQALVANGVKPGDPSVKKAVAYLKTQQNKDGGFPFSMSSSYGTDSDASSTAWVIQGLLAAGEDIEGKAWVKAAITPMGFLMSLQNADGGIAYQKAVPQSDPLSTLQAVPALMETPYPVQPASQTGARKPAAKTSETPGLNTTSLLLIALIVLSVIAIAVGFVVYAFKGKNK